MSITNRSVVSIKPCYGLDCPIKTHCLRAVSGEIKMKGKENFKYDSTLDDDGQEIGCSHFVEIRGRE